MNSVDVILDVAIKEAIMPVLGASPPASRILPPTANLPLQDELTSSVRAMENMQRKLSTSSTMARRRTIIRYEESMPAQRLVDGVARPESGSRSEKARPSSLPPEPKSQKRYLSELSALESLVLKHAAVLTLYQGLKGQFTFEELLDMVDSSRGTLWSRLKLAVKNNKPVKKGLVFSLLSSLSNRRYFWGPIGFVS